MESQILETNLTFESLCLPRVDLHDGRIRIYQRKDAFRRRESRLDLRPERGQVEDRVHEIVEAEDEQVPHARADDALLDGQPARVNEDGDEDAAHRVQDREDQREHQPALHVDRVGGLVGEVEGLENASFLAEVLGDGNPADGLLDGRVDVCHGLHPALGDAARQGAEAEREAEGDGDESHHQQGHVPFGAKEDDSQQDGLEHLRGDVGEDDDELAEVVRVGGDAADDAPGGELVVERQVVIGRGVESLTA